HAARRLRGVGAGGRRRRRARGAGAAGGRQRRAPRRRRGGRRAPRARRSAPRRSRGPPGAADDGACRGPARRRAGALERRPHAPAARRPARRPWNARVKRGAVDAMRAALPPTSAALLAGLLLGERSDLPSEVDAAFRRAGVYHVLAVSGFNVALVASTTWTVLALARVSRRLAS